MRVTLTIDPTDHRDAVLRGEIDGWLHHCTRSSWTFEETAADDDDEGRTVLTYDFTDPLDADDLYRWRGLLGRGRRL